MAQAQRRPGSGPAASDDGMKGLTDLFSRSPTPARVTMHVERLLAGWREALDPDAYAERLSEGAATQPAGVRSQAGAAVASTPGPRRYKVQAASPGLAMLSELDRSGGEGSQLQVGVGDQVPGYGRVSAIQQRGSTWLVQTDRGAIQ